MENVTFKSPDPALFIFIRIGATTDQLYVFEVGEWDRFPPEFIEATAAKLKQMGIVHYFNLVRTPTMPNLENWIKSIRSGFGLITPQQMQEYFNVISSMSDRSCNRRCRLLSVNACLPTRLLGWMQEMF